MKRTTYIFLIALAVLFLVTPLIAYYLKFRNYNVSSNTEAWGQFGDYLNGTFMPIIALVGVTVTFLLGIISEKRNDNNLKIDQQKQRPLLHIGYYDDPDKIRIFMKNKGSGPLIINNYRLVNLDDNKEIQSLFECLPPIERKYFDNYTGNQNNTVLSANEETELFRFELTAGENKNIYNDSRDLIRIKLAKYKIVVDYKDVYDNQMPTYERSLAWFGRDVDGRQ